MRSESSVKAELYVYNKLLKYINRYIDTLQKQIINSPCVWRKEEDVYSE